LHKNQRNHLKVEYMSTPLEINVQSEIGELEGVVLHTPGPEVENLTPGNAQRALYSDILNLEIAKNEYRQLSGVLGKITQTFQVGDLFTDALKNPKGKEELIKKVCEHENAMHLRDELLDMSADELSRLLIQGVPLKVTDLTSFQSKDRFSLPPLYNFYFTRDASMTVNDEVLIGKMANAVRDRESMIMENIFNYAPQFKAKTCNALDFPEHSKDVMIEGGDVLIARDDILVIGNGCRTTSKGIDFILSRLLAQKEEKRRHILVQELPSHPESFIHLDMVFTFLDKNKCMAYEPLILQPSKYQTIHIETENGEVVNIYREEGLLPALKKLGIDLEPVICGGTKDLWTQEREQWHSGANFFSVGPGKVIGYARNTATIEEMNKHGFEVLEANEVIRGTRRPENYDRYVITLEGSELPRGGGGARCMTMPVRRKKVDW
jgi:arginine deiminase